MTRRMTVPAFALAVVALARSLAAAAPGDLPWRIERGGFVDASGRAVAPRGFNYIRLREHHATFEPQRYDAAAVGAVLSRWRSDGFNAVRVFVNTQVRPAGTIARAGRSGLAADYVRTLAGFLEQARTNGVAVMLCTESFPHVPPYTDELAVPAAGVSAANADYLDGRRIAAKARYLRDLATSLRTERASCVDAILAYDIQNELCFHGSAPFTLESGSYTTDVGRVYALPADRQRLADDAAIRFIDTVAAALRGADPRARVSAGVFTYAAVGRRGSGDFSVKAAAWQNRIPFRPLAILRSKADMLDLHTYAANETAWRRDLTSVEFDEVRRIARELGKPVVAGEFGAFKKAFPSSGAAAEWMADLASSFATEGFAGWLYWTYDTHEQGAELWHACDDDGAIYERLRGVPAVRASSL